MVAITCKAPHFKLECDYDRGVFVVVSRSRGQSVELLAGTTYSVAKSTTRTKLLQNVSRASTMCQCYV